MSKFWAITSNAFIETIRQPIYAILLLVTFGVLVLDVAITGYAMDTKLTEGDTRLLVDLGLSTMMMGGLFIAAFSASGVLAREIELKTVLTVVSKPVPRAVVLGGKFAGVAAAVTVAFYLMAIVFLMTVRHGVMSSAADPFDMPVIVIGLGAFALAALVSMFCNYFFAWEFTSTNVAASLVLYSIAIGLIAFIGKGWKVTAFGEGLDVQVLAVLLLVWLAVLIMVGLAIAVSTRLGQMATLGVCVGIFLFSLLTGILFKPYANENVLAGLAYRLVPNLTYFFALDALTLNQPITAGYVALAGAYAACYLVAALLVGMALLQTRELDAEPASSSAPPMVNLYAWVLRITALAVALVALTGLAGSLRQANIGRNVIMLVAGIAGWLLAANLGRGTKWALVAVVVLTAGELICCAYLLLGPIAIQPLYRAAVLAVSIGHALYVLVLCLRGSTRAHFASTRKLAVNA
ncbi:MAG: hypothetical protein HQ546_01375 [Planctomycetes bacterium]|nr:hypothetical protein [Planctomycetota bacterium]